MLILKILLCLAFYPSWSSTIKDEKEAKLYDEWQKAQEELNSVHILDDGVEVWQSKLDKMMKPVTAYVKVIFNEIKEFEKENVIEENGTSSYTPGMVDEVLRALTTAGASSDDFLKDLNELGPKLADLIKTAVPIYGLFFEKPESEGNKALKDFKTRSEVIRNDIYTQKPSKEYDDEVDRWITYGKVWYDNLLRWSMGQRRDDYSDNCRYSDAIPKTILKLLKSHSITECGASITPREIEDMAKHRRHCKAVLRRVLSRFQVEKESTDSDPSYYLQGFMNRYKHLDRSFPMENMRVFAYSHSSYRDAIYQWFNEIPRLSTAPNIEDFKDECFLRLPTWERYERTFNYTRIGLLARKLHTDLIEVALHSAICSNVNFSERSAMDVYVDGIVAVATNITTFTSKWLEESLAAAWPVIHNQIFQDQIETIVKKPGHFDRNMLIKAAEITSSRLNETGIPGYTYDMLIVKAPEKNFQFHFESLSNNFHFDKGDFGFNTVLVRRPFNYSNQMDQLSLQDKMRRLRIQIESEMKNLYDAKNITEVAEGLKNKLGSFATKNGFRGFAIARKWEKNIYKSCSAIDDVQYSYDPFSTIYNFTYQNSGNMLQHCETFNFYFFLEDTNDPLANLTNPKLDDSMKSAIPTGAMASKNENPKPNSIERVFTSQIVDEAVKALKAASTSSGDPVVDLREMGPKLDSLAEAANPIGAIIAEKLNPEPESEEYKVLMEFKNQSAEIWSNISAITSTPIGSLGGQKLTKDYEKQVSLSISNMKHHIDIILNPEIRKQEDFDDFWQEYRELLADSQSKPRNIIWHLERNLITYCGASLTTEDVEVIAEKRAILMRVFRRLQVENDTIPDPSIYLSKFMTIYGNVHEFYSFEWIVKYFFDKHFSNYEDAIDTFLGQLLKHTIDREFLKIEDRCLLRALTIEKSFDYTRIGLFVRKLQHELIDLTFFSGIARATLMKKFISADWNDVLATNVTTFASKWLNESLTSAWPLIHNQIFQDQIRKVVKKPGHFDRDMLKKTAELTNSILNKTGIPGYTYDMLIVRSPEKNFQFHIEGLSNDSYFDKGDFGFHTVLIRRPLNNSNQLDQLNLQDKMRRLRIQIESEMEHLYDTKNVTEVAEGLKNKLGSFVTKNGFQGFAIARKWEKIPFKSCSAIDDVQYSKDSFSTIYYFTYQNSGNLLQHCQTFNFYFFL